ncbi:MAG TPA: DUF642 domain-containing protein [Armatimonadota bacterium]|jgi:Tol biopolymer transport system component
MPAWCQVVYSNDFAAGAGSEWSSGTVSVTPGTSGHAADRFLGEFSAGAVSLSLASLPAHESITVSFDLYMIRSWDGNDTRDLGAGPVGPDRFSVTADGRSLLNTTFSAWNDALDERQSHPVAYSPAQLINYVARTGAAESNTLGFLYDGYVQDSVYRLSYTFPHAAPTLAVRFQGAPNENIGNESWGLDNVAVSVSASRDLLLNGGFETAPIGIASLLLYGGSSFYGWRVGGQNVDLVQTDFAPATGSQCLDLNGGAAGGVYQDIATTAGQTYILRFALAGNPNGAASPPEKALSVRWNGAPVISPTFDTTDRSARKPGWTNMAARVVGTGYDRLSFESQTAGAWGPAIDDVALEPLPSGAAALYPANGHYYQCVTRALTWDQARVTAEQMTANGWAGHLATATSTAEREFITGLACPTVIWLGGFQQPGHAPGEGWQWVTGEPWTYANWRAGEPNDSGSDENRLDAETSSAGGWNDDSPAAVQPFVVEYEAPATRCAYQVEPFGYVAGRPLAQQPVAAVAGPDGTVDAAYSGPVTLSLKAGSGDPEAALTGMTTAPAVKGVARFRDVGVDRAGEGYVILASAATVAEAESTPFSLGAAGLPYLERVSVSPSGAPANAGCGAASVSQDGRFVAFTSAATNLVAGHSGTLADVFVRDRLLGVTECVSTSVSGGAANGDSAECSISADGRVVAFRSDASNLAAGDTNAVADIFVRDRAAGTTERVSVSSAGAQANGGSGRPYLSGDGRFVVFTSLAANLVAGDTNGLRDVFVRDRMMGTTTRVSVSSTGAQGDGESGNPWGGVAISQDGRFVAFESLASNLAAGDTNGAADVFVRNLSTGVTERVSVSTYGVQGEANAGCNIPAISADGRVVVYYSWFTTMVSGDTNGWADVFVRDRSAKTTQRVSLAYNGVQGNADSFEPSLSGDGRSVAFQTRANNLVAGASGALEVLQADLGTRKLSRLSASNRGAAANADAAEPSVSADGRFVAFTSAAGNLAPGDVGAAQIYLWGPRTAAFSVVDVIRCLKIAAGFEAADRWSVDRLDGATSAPGIDAADAVTLMRKAAGIASNP